MVASRQWRCFLFTKVLLFINDLKYTKLLFFFLFSSFLNASIHMHTKSSLLVFSLTEKRPLSVTFNSVVLDVRSWDHFRNGLDFLR